VRERREEQGRAGRERERRGGKGKETVPQYLSQVGAFGKH